jgi:hypothetical protein
MVSPGRGCRPRGRLALRRGAQSSPDRDVDPPGWTSRGLWGDPSRPGRVDRPRGALPREHLRASPPVSLHGRETPWRKVPLLLRRPGPSARSLRSDTGGLGPVSACAQAQRDLASCRVGGCPLGRATVWGAARRSRTRRPTFTARPQDGKSMRPSQEPLRHTAWAVRPAREQHAMSHQARLAGEHSTSPGAYATSRALHGQARRTERRSDVPPARVTRPTQGPSRLWPPAASPQPRCGRHSPAHC